MRRIFLSAVLLLTACAAPLPVTPPAGQPAAVGAPQVQVGDTWRYAARDGYTGIAKGALEYRVEAISDGTISVTVLQGGQSSRHRYTADWNWRERPMTNLQNFRFDPPFPALPFPLVAGKTWRAHVNASDPATGRSNRVRIDGEVLGWERVKVPAGTYDTLKIRRLVYAGNFGHFRSEEQIVEIDWYAPQLGQVVRHEGSSAYLDTSRGCDDDHGMCNVVRNDWTVMELIGHRPGIGRAP
jgi:hypothetical protein